MRSKTRLLAILFSLIVFSLGAMRLEAQASYLLVCRGGGDLHFTYTPFSNFSSDPQIWITFQRGATGVGSGWDNLSVLNPGQCSWLDRGISGDEPDRIVILHPILGVNEFSIQWMRGQVAGISSSLYYINALQDPNHYQSFRAYNDGQGNFVVTEIDQGTYHLDAPGQISPANGTTFGNFPRDTVLSWAPVQGASSYTVEVDCKDGCRAGWWCDEFDRVWLAQTGITGTSFNFSFVGAQPGRWRVWAIYPNGHEGAKSDWWQFTYTQ